MDILFNQLNLLVSLLSILLAIHFLRQKTGLLSASRFLSLGLIAMAAHSAMLLGASLLGRPSLPADLLPGLALLLTAFIHLFFSILRNGALHPKKLIPHFIVPVFVTLIMASGMALWTVDWVVITGQLVYFCLMARLATFGRAQFEKSTEHTKIALFWLVVLTAYIGVSASNDLLIAYEVRLGALPEHAWFLWLSLALKVALVLSLLILRLEKSAAIEWLFQLPLRSTTVSEDEAHQFANTFNELNQWLQREGALNREDNSLKTTAKALGVTPRHLSRAVNHVTGESYSRQLNRYRVRYAKEMLSKNPDLAITTILYDAGFNTKSSFNREFKSIMGITPTAYREECRNQGPSRKARNAIPRTPH